MLMSASPNKRTFKFRSQLRILIYTPPSLLLHPSRQISDTITTSPANYTISFMFVSFREYFLVKTLFVFICNY
jgi:hypothetical protein